MYNRVEYGDGDHEELSVAELEQLGVQLGVQQVWTEVSPAAVASGVDIGVTLYVLFNKIEWLKAKITAFDDNEATVMYMKQIKFRKPSR